MRQLGMIRQHHVQGPSELEVVIRSLYYLSSLQVRAECQYACFWRYFQVEFALVDAAARVKSLAPPLRHLVIESRFH